MFLCKNLLAVVGKELPPPPPKMSTSSFLEPVNVTLHVKKGFYRCNEIKDLERERDFKNLI